MKSRTNIRRGGRRGRFVRRCFCLLTAYVVLLLIPPVGSEARRDGPQSRWDGADRRPQGTLFALDSRGSQPSDGIRGTLAGGGTVSRQVKLSSGEFLHVTAAQKGVDVALSLLTPEGKTLVRVNNNGLLYGPESLSWVVGREGTYSLLVSSADEQAAAGAYQLTFDERRPAGPKDEVRVAAERRLAAANRHLASGRMPRAREEFRRAWELFREAGDARQEAGALIQLGHVRRDTGSYAEAIPHYEQALFVSEAAGDRFDQAAALDSLGVSYYALGDTGRAFGYYERALSLRCDVGERQGEAATLKNLGVAYGSLGKNQMALDSLKQSLSISREIGDGRGEIDTLLELASVYRFLNQQLVALDLSVQALRRSRELHIESSGRDILGLMGAIHRSLGNYGEALETLSRAVLENRMAGDDRGEARCLYHLGDVYVSTGNHARSLEYYEKAAQLNARLGDRRGLARALYRAGEIYNQSGHRRQQALSAFNRALRLSRAVSDRQTEADALHSLARVSREEGDLDHSRSYMEAALRVTDSMRYDIGSRSLRTSYSASTQMSYEFYIDLLMQLHGQRPAEGFALAALEANERARARSLSELLANTRASARDESPSGEESAPPPLSVAEIQAHVVGDDTILLEYALGDRRSFLWAVTRDSVNAYELPGRVAIEEAAHKLYQKLTSPTRYGSGVRGFAADVDERPTDLDDESYAPEAAALSRMLLGPVAWQLGTKRLLIVGQGALQYVPFEALPAPSSADAGGEPDPLMADHVIEYSPSASVLELLRREAAGRKPAPKAIAVIADPVFEADDPRLPVSAAAEQWAPSAVRGDATPRLTSTRAEADAIMALAPAGRRMMAVDFEANRDTALSPDLGKYQIVHFATHGLVNNEQPELSGLVLSLVDEHGRRQDGMLGLSDIYNMKLSADLVVLSACRTGLGQDVGGEGLLGLTRGFMYAGAQSVVASLWKVDDRATAALMENFYKGLLRDGLTPAAALRAAKIEMRKQERWRHPYYWAGFILQGDGNRKLPPTAKGTPHPYLLLAALLPVGMGVLWVGLRRRHQKSVSGHYRNHTCGAK